MKANQPHYIDYKPMQDNPKLTMDKAIIPDDSFWGGVDILASPTYMWIASRKMWLELKMLMNFNQPIERQNVKTLSLMLNRCLFRKKAQK